MGYWTSAFPAGGTETTSASDLPDWYQNYLQQLTGKAAAIADEPYQAYQGQRIAGFTPQQQQAFDLANQNVGAWRPGMQQAQNLAIQGSTYDPGALSQFMNPYTSGVVNEMARLGNQNFTENLLPAANSAFTLAGQFGSTRNQDAVNRAARDVQANILGQQTGALQQGFNTANTNYLNWAGLGQKGSQLMSDLAARQQGLGAADVGALSTVGGAQQNLGQQNLDWAYQQFQQQQQQPTQNLAMLNAIIRGLSLPGSTTTSKVSTEPQTSLGSQVAGGLSTLAGLYQ
jgi:hypothetical protein